MKPWKTLVGLAVLAISVTRCDLGTPPLVKGGGGTEVEGIIVDQRGNPAAGIWVRVYPDSAKPLFKGSNASEALVAIRDSAKTDANGAFSLSDLPSGTYNLVASARRNDTTLALFRRSIVIAGNANLGTDTLRMSGGLTLNVAIQGSTIGGAQCYIPGSPYITLSDISGLCSLTGLPPGNYTVSVSLAGLPLGQSGNIAVVSFQVTDAGIVNLTWVSIPPGVPPSSDSEWVLTVDPIQTWFIGSGSAGFNDSIAFTGLREVQTYATWDLGGSAVGRNFQAGDGDFDPRARTAQTLKVNLRFVNKDMLPSSGKARAFDAKGVLTHSDSAMPWKNLTRLTSKYRRAAIIVNLPDSVSSASIPGKVFLKINRVVIRKNGATVLDSSRAGRFANMIPHAFVVEYLNPNVTDSLEVLAYGEYSEPGQLLFKGTVKLTPTMTVAPELLMAWVGPTSHEIFRCLIAASLPPTLVSPAYGANNVATSALLMWNRACEASEYRVQVATDSTFTQVVAYDSTADTLRYVVLEANKTYSWRVASKLSGGWTNWSSSRNFTTVSSGATAPAAPILLTPVQDTTILSLTANLTWVGETGASYRFQIALDSAFVSMIVDSIITNYTGFITGLNASTTYYWRVFATNANGSTSSVTRRFKTPTVAVPAVWTPRTSNTTNVLYGLASRGDSLLVAVGSGGTIITSTDGNTWTARTSGIITQLSGIVWGNNQFVAVGDSGIVLTSPNGTAWTKRSVPGGTGLYAVIRDSTNFIAVGNGGTLFYSADGVTWQSSASGTTTGLYAIASSGSRVVVVGSNGTILTSLAEGGTSGPTWTTRSSATTSVLTAVTWNGSAFVAAGAGGTVVSSPDGITWTARTSGTTNILYAAKSSNGTTKVTGGSGTMLTSTNLATWSTETTGSASILYALTKFRTLWVAVGNSGTVLTSP